MRTTKHLIDVAHAAVANVPETRTGIAAMSAMRDLLECWHLEAASTPCFDGAAMLDDINATILQLRTIRRTIEIEGEI